MTTIDQYFIKIQIVFIALFSFGWNPLRAQSIDTQPQNDTIPGVNQAELWKYTPTALFESDKVSSTAAISSVSGEVLSKTPVANLSNTLYGLLPGLNVLQGTGEPGNDRAYLWIRGIGSYNYEDYTIFVDGFQTTFNYLQYLSPAEIDQISVFKDAAALAPFGMKGANGVIWVTTKRGQSGKPTIQIQARYGFQSPININDPLDSYNYASLYNEAVSNDNGRLWSPVYSDAQLEEYRNGRGINTRWYDEVLKDNGYFARADATFSGGSKGAKYFVLLGYMNNQGLYDVKNDDQHSNAGLEQFNFRTNLDFTIFQIFEGKVDLGGRIEDRSYPNFDATTLWNNLEKYPSNIYEPINEDGTWAGTNTYPDNPLASIRELGYISAHDRTLQANFTLKENLDFLTHGLYVSESASFSTWNRGTYKVSKNYARFLNGMQQTPDQNTNYSIYDDYGTNQWNWYQFQGQVGYSRDFGKSHLTSAINYLWYTRNVDSNQNGAAGLNMKYGYQNLGGRIHYNYDGRYSAEFGFAYSGSDNFDKNNRYAFYPSLSAAWTISNESFLKENNIINFAKLRISAGKSGYDVFSGGRYLYQLYYTYSRSYPTGNGTPTWNGGITPAYTPNPDISAEESMKYNVGTDIQLFKSLDITVDAFLDKRSKIITPDHSLMAVFGANPPYRNIGKVTNKGFEVSVLFSNQLGKLKYQIGGMAFYHSNKIDYMAEIPPVTLNAAQTGRSIGTLFGYQALGFYDIDDFDNEGNLKVDEPIPEFGAVQPGDIKYQDINGDKKVNELDMVAIGNNFLPKWTYSLMMNAEYKGFDFSFLFQGVAGKDVNLLDASNQTVTFRDNGNAYPLAFERWAYYPDEGIDTRQSATYPRLSTLDNPNNYRNSTFWIKNGAFFRLRNVEIGYTFLFSAMNKRSASSMRFFINGVNLFTWSPLLKNYDIDPETMMGYPALKSFNCGLNVNF
jgi:TonB-linked SusC/RagA family outer membrane protein